MSMRLFRLSAILALALSLAAPAFAQSTNTSTLIVTVLDQNGGAQKGAKVSVTNTATGATREQVSSDDGTATFAALPLTGTYKVAVDKTGFNPEEVKDIALRGGETAAVKVKLTVSGGQ